MERLTRLAVATCRNCHTELHLNWGDLTGSRWYHDEGGRITCPRSPLADPDPATIVKSARGLTDADLAREVEQAGKAKP